jgi:hypothetical protein
MSETSASPGAARIRPALRGSLPRIVTAGHIAALCTFAAGALVALQTLRMMAACWHPLPMGDQWGEIVTGRPITWSWLVSQHVEHRIAFPRLVFIADRWVAGETNRLNYAVNLLIQAGLAALVLQVARGAGIRGRAARLWAAGLCLSLLFWAGQYQNFVWGFQVQFFGVILAAAGSFAMLALNRPTPAVLAATLLLETVAVYTLASGILVPVLAVMLAVLLRRPRRVVLALGLAALLLSAVYLHGYATPADSSDPGAAWRHAGGILVYVLVEIGAPLGNLALHGRTMQAGFMVSVAAGLLGAYLFARLAWAMLRQGGAWPPHQAALMALAAFVLGMFLVTAAGRFGKGLESAFVSRYTTPGVAFWCCMALLAAARAAPDRAALARIMIATLPLPLLMAATEGANVAAASDWVALRRAATPAFLANVADIDLLRPVYAVAPDGAFQGSIGQRARPLLRAAGTSVFADPWASWLGTKLAAHVTVTDGHACQGSLDRILQVAPGPAPGWRATGHAWQAATGAPPARLLLADRQGRIVGFGAGGLDLHALGLAPATPPARQDGGRRSDGWAGAFAGADPGAVTAYALTGPGTACPLANPAPLSTR